MPPIPFAIKYWSPTLFSLIPAIHAKTSQKNYCTGHCALPRFGWSRGQEGLYAHTSSSTSKAQGIKFLYAFSMHRSIGGQVSCNHSIGTISIARLPTSDWLWPMGLCVMCIQGCRGQNQNF
jgi:hypothetical protein